jgi:hypothetical protein
MALLLHMFRQAAITGRTDQLNAWFADRQGARWAEQTVRNAFTPHPDTLRRLTELHEHGVLTDAELARLRGRMGV